MTIVLEGERPTYSLNEYWAGLHWSKRRTEADRVHMVVRSCIPVGVKMFEVPVTIAVHVFFAGNPFDADNIVAKPYIDGLCGWLIEDDDIRFLKGIACYPYIDKNNPRVEIDILEAT